MGSKEPYVPVKEKSAFLVCSRCGASACLPEDRDHSALWAAGWRWRGAYERAGTAGFVPRCFVYSCPSCPAVIG